MYNKFIYGFIPAKGKAENIVRMGGCKSTVTSLEFGILTIFFIFLGICQLR